MFDHDGGAAQKYVITSYREMIMISRVRLLNVLQGDDWGTNVGGDRVALLPQLASRLGCQWRIISVMRWLQFSFCYNVVPYIVFGLININVCLSYIIL